MTRLGAGCRSQLCLFPRGERGTIKKLGAEEEHSRTTGGLQFPASTIGTLELGNDYGAMLTPQPRPGSRGEVSSSGNLQMETDSHGWTHNNAF